MKEYIEKYKEFKQNRRQVGLTKLGFWIVFFGVILLIYLIPTGGHKTVYTPNADALKDEQNIVSRCEYDFSIQDVVDTMYRDEDITDFLESKKLIKTRVLHK